MIRLLRANERRACGIAAICAWLALAGTARAEGQADARKKVESSLAALRSGAYEQALEGFRDAEVSFPDSPELAYNRGVALYRMGEYDSAKEAFASALSTRDIALEQKAKFNLGNCAYSLALQKLTDYAGAIEELKRAIDYYRDALELNPNDQDARANIETAYLLIKDLLDKKKQEEEKKKQEDEQEKQDQPTTQPSQDPQCSQPSEEQDQQDQQQSPDEEQQKQDQQQQQQGGKQGEDQQNQPQEQQGELESADQQKEQDQQNSQKPQPQEMRKMTREEAARLLQAVRDRERERREELRERAMAGRPPVDRDW